MVRHLGRWTIDLALGLSLGTLIGNAAWVMFNVIAFAPGFVIFPVGFALLMVIVSAHHVGHRQAITRANRALMAQQRMIETQQEMIRLQAVQLDETVVVPIISIYTSGERGEHGHMRLGPVCMN